jgi:hypothetical protein
MKSWSTNLSRNLSNACIHIYRTLKVHSVNESLAGVNVYEGICRARCPVNVHTGVRAAASRQNALIVDILPPKSSDQTVIVEKGYMVTLVG